MTLETAWLCPSCGYDGFRTGEIKSTFECSMLWFCPVCQTALDRLDPLGAIEAAYRSDKPETFAEFVKRPDVLQPGDNRR